MDAIDIEYFLNLWLQDWMKGKDGHWNGYSKRKTTTSIYIKLKMSDNTGL